MPGKERFPDMADFTRYVRSLGKKLSTGRTAVGIFNLPEQERATTVGAP